MCSSISQKFPAALATSRRGVVAADGPVSEGGVRSMPPCAVAARCLSQSSGDFPQEEQHALDEIRVGPLQHSDTCQPPLISYHATR